MQITFVQGYKDKYGTKFALQLVASNYPRPFVDDAFYKYQMIVVSCTHVRVFYFVSLAYMSVFVSVPYCFYYYSSVILLHVIVFDAI